MATVTQNAASVEEARVKAIFQVIVCVVFCVCATYTLAFNFTNVVFFKDDINEEGENRDRFTRTSWSRHVIFLCVNIALCVSCATLLVLTRRYESATKLKAGFIIVLICWTVIVFVSGTTAEIFRFTTLGFDCVLFLGTLRDAAVMDGLAAICAVIFLVLVTLDHIAWATGAFNVHLAEQTYCHHSIAAVTHSWLTHVVPTLVNFLVVRRYCSSVRKGEVLALESVEVAYIVADKLANYALDDAETCLRETSRDVHHDAILDIRKPLSRVLENLKTYQAFLPKALFEKSIGGLGARRSSEKELDKDILPNAILCSAMAGKEVSYRHMESAVNRLRDLDYSLEAFHEDMIGAFPELSLHTHTGDKISSGRTGMDEYKRTLGALYSVYSLLRLDIDGKEIFSFGVDDKGKPRSQPVGEEAVKKQGFYEKMPWHIASALLKRAGLLLDEKETHTLRKERVAAMLALTAIHDVMKNTALLPFVHPRHAPYKGYTANERIHDHDVALGYILEHFPTLLPSFKALEPGQRAPVFFTQGKMDFNNGWFVQGEAPPGALFSRFKEVIMEGRAAKADISFYFVHWLTDLAGAEVFSDGAWPGAEKFTIKFPVKVLSAFLESFGFVDRLAVASEAAVMEDYLESRWKNLELADAFPMQMDIAVMRLALMAQGFESQIVKSLRELSHADCIVLSEELARTGCFEQFIHAPSSVRSNPCGPALLIYYSPALLQKAGSEFCTEALHILACVCRAARVLFPLDEQQAERTVTIRVDEMKILTPPEIDNSAPWYLRQTSGVDAEAVRGTPRDGEGVLIDLQEERLKPDDLASRRHSDNQEMQEPFEVGDKVRVIKESRMKGNTAVVINANWNGMVKVSMDEDDEKGRVKSFRFTDVELVNNPKANFYSSGSLPSAEEAIETLSNAGPQTELVEVVEDDVIQISFSDSFAPPHEETVAVPDDLCFSLGCACTTAPSKKNSQKNSQRFSHILCV